MIPFNNLSLPVTWVENSDIVLAANAEVIKNVTVGDWVKKPEDDDSEYRQVTGKTALQLTLGNNYSGSSATATGVTFDQNSDVNQGVYLANTEDIIITEGDAVKIDDTIFIDDIADSDWFSTVNSGTFDITQVGTDGATYKPFVRVENSSGTAETAIDVGISLIGFSIIEDENNKFESIRVVEHAAIDEFNADRRILYLTPDTQPAKFSQSNGTQVEAVSKLGYSTDVTTGIDGYSYYTGLLRTVQRVVDGYEPDLANFPGRRAIGGIIETLPSLIHRITVSVDVTTNEGVNLNEISNDVKSTIVNYINQLGVGEDVILAEMIVKVMAITGIAAVTFNVPTPDTERISVADNERAFIENNDVSVA